MMNSGDTNGRTRLLLRHLFPVVLMLVATPFALAQETNAVGGTKGSKLSFKNYGCGNDYVLIGLEVNYGSQRVAKVRGLCKKIDRDGNLLGSAKTTQWSPLETGSGYNYSKTVKCPSGYVVSGPYARVTEYSSRFALNAVGLLCRKPKAGGGTTGTEQQIAPVGASGGSLTGHTCPQNLPAMNISGTFKNYIESLKMGCGNPQITVTPPDKPTNLSPTSTGSNPTNATGTWSWRAAAGATGYYLLIGTSDNSDWRHSGTSPYNSQKLYVKDCGNTTSCQSGIPRSFTTGSLRWKVEAYNSAGAALSNEAIVGNPNAR